MFGSVGAVEIAIIVGIAILIFGPSQLPKLGRSIGQTIKEFRGIRKELESERDDVTNEVNQTRRAVERELR